MATERRDKGAVSPRRSGVELLFPEHARRCPDCGRLTMKRLRTDHPRPAPANTHDCTLPTY